MIEPKFKVGDRVRIKDDNDQMSLIPGDEFVVTKENRAEYRTPTEYYYEGDRNNNGVWEKNLDLVVDPDMTEWYKLGIMGQSLIVNNIPSDKIVKATNEEPKDDPVEHPSHYTSHPKGIECIDVIEDNPFANLAVAIKYLWRVSWGGKFNDIEDLKKAIWFIEREIYRREKGAQK